jgi:ceramide glucosyltransferase
LESLGISTDFVPGVLVARLLERGLRFGLGSTLAFRRADLDRIGGFKSIVDFLADDYELGRRIAALGLQVVLSEVVVETHLPAYDLRGFLSHQLRWARGVRDSRAGGYIGLVSTFGLMWSLLYLIAAHAAPWSWVVLGAVSVLRLAVAVVGGKNIVRDRQVFGLLWVLTLPDLIAFFVWM